MAVSDNASGLLNACHHYDDVPWKDCAEPRISTKQFHSLFRPSLKGAPAWCRDVVSSKAKTDWFSPRPLGEVQQIQDCITAKHYFKNGAPYQAGDTWCALLFGGRVCPKGLRPMES